MDQPVHYQVDWTEDSRTGACGVVGDRLGEMSFTLLVGETTCDGCKATLGAAALDSPEPERPHRCFCGIAITQASRICTELDCPYR